MFLGKVGIAVSGFASGVEAVEWFRDNYRDVDLVILDMKMPQMDGTACFNRLKEIDPDVQVLILSGYMEDESVQSLLRRGAVMFFQKPLKYPELTQWVLDWIGRSSRKKRLAASMTIH